MNLNLYVGDEKAWSIEQGYQIYGLLSSGHAQHAKCANIHLKLKKFFTIGSPCIGVAEGVSALSWLYVHTCSREVKVKNR